MLVICNFIFIVNWAGNIGKLGYLKLNKNIFELVSNAYMR